MEAGGVTKLAKRLYEHLKRTALLPHGAHVLVACSGGPDSLALLLLLRELVPMLHLDVTVAHYDHGLRGAASKADAAFVQTFCEALGIPCFVGNAPPGSIVNAKASMETEARRLRYLFLEEVRRETGADVICTAHHADDQAETVLMHLLRGTGLDGLAGIPAFDEERHLVRPLLPFRKQELIAYCESQGITPRHDATNDVPDGLRNRVRLELLPELAAGYNPRITESLCRLAEIAGAECGALEALAEGRLQEISCNVTATHLADWRRGMEAELPASLALGAKRLRHMHPGLARRVVRRYLAVLGHGVDVSYERMGELLALAAKQTGCVVELPGFSIMLYRGWLRPCHVHPHVFDKQES